MILFEATTPGALEAFLKYAEPGQTVLYHVGFIPLDRVAVDATKGLLLSELQRAVWRARDRLYLTQKRLGAFHYEYRATYRSDHVGERKHDVAGVRASGRGAGSLARVPVLPRSGAERDPRQSGDGESAEGN